MPGFDPGRTTTQGLKKLNIELVSASFATTRDGSGNVAQKSDFTFFQFLSRLFLHISLLSKIGEAPYSWIASILIQVKVVVLPSKPIVFFLKFSLPSRR